MIPLFVDCSGRRVVIFGGGDVAARKAAYFAGSAMVIVVSRSFVPAFDGMNVTRKELDIGTASGRELAALLTEAFLVIAAVSDPAVNNRIGRLCRVTGTLFNNADGEPGDVVLPAVAAGKLYTIAVSTGGASPAVSRLVRQEIEDRFPHLDLMIGLQQRLRGHLKETVPDQKQRTAILRDVLKDNDVWDALAESPDLAWNLVGTRYLHD